jgi:hypothetical protein
LTYSVQTNDVPAYFEFNQFDHEAAPQAELDAAALAAHADSQSRYWQAASGIAEMRHIH